MEECSGLPRIASIYFKYISDDWNGILFESIA